MNEKIDKMGVLWLSRAEKLFDKDLTFRKEYDYFDTDRLRCECCGTKLRTKPRTPKSKKIYALLKGGNNE